jgi:hypothetical protein
VVAKEHRHVTPSTPARAVLERPQKPILIARNPNPTLACLACASSYVEEVDARLCVSCQCTVGADAFDGHDWRTLARCRACGFVWSCHNGGA